MLFSHHTHQHVLQTQEALDILYIALTNIIGTNINIQTINELDSDHLPVLIHTQFNAIFTNNTFSEKLRTTDWSVLRRTLHTHLNSRLRAIRHSEQGTPQARTEYNALVRRKGKGQPIKEKWSLKKALEIWKLKRTLRFRNKHFATPAIITDTGIKYTSDYKANANSDILEKNLP
ncbi:hypothetical protein PR048_019781 [Dryococelus australis]|uniref:Endonuclease/exonuclease/phosphatase domain-containing protein n=1 Tax=Dryococelus australis TaxID=614101 RepID=A0ABQ9H4J5_9NEOP|nr:hypothetical protein PR048_019781 [Dryococelus australis]